MLHSGLNLNLNTNIDSHDNLPSASTAQTHYYVPATPNMAALRQIPQPRQKQQQGLPDSNTDDHYYYHPYDDHYYHSCLHSP